MATLLVFLATITSARAEAPDPLGLVVGATVDAVLTDDERDVLLQQCPQDDPESLAACLGQSADALPVLEAATQRALAALTETFGETAVNAHGEALLGLDGEQLTAVAEACGPAEDPSACITQAFSGEGEGEPAPAGGEGELVQPAAEGQPGQGAGGEVDYPEEALALLPREVLDALPKVITTFLRPADYVALQEACPQEDLEQALTCLLEDDAGLELLDTLHTRAVIASLLSYMDQELPNRLAPEQLDTLGETCAEPGEAWGTCAFEKGMESDECYEAEGVLANCLVGDDHVTEVYLAIQADKKRVFGPDLYVEFRGLMSLMSLEDVEAMRQRCPQQEQEALYDCLLNDEVVDTILGMFVQISEMMMEEAQKELSASGQALSDDELAEYGERFVGMLLTFPLHAIDSLAKGCLAAHPELETATSPDDIGAMMTCIEEGSHTDPMANPAYISPERLRQWLGIAREKVTTSLRAKEEASQARSFKTILILLGILGVLGAIVVLLMPLRLVKQYPDRKSQLWRASIIASVTFLGTVILLGATLLAMRTAQGRVATDTSSPKMVVANGVFDVLEKDEYVEQFSDMSRERLDFIKTPLRVVVEAQQADQEARYLAFSAFVSEHWVDQLNEPELRRVAKNAAMIKEHTERFKSAFGFYRQVDWIMGYVPLVLSILAVVLYMIPLRETLVNIATAPARAAQGSAEGVMGRAMSTVVAELKLLGPYLLIMVAYLIVSGAFLSLAVEPIIELLMSYSLMTVLYILLTEASGFVLYASLGGSILLLVGTIAIYILAMLFFIGSVRKLLRARFHEGQPLTTHGKFWGLGTLATVFVLLFPVGFAALLRWVAMEHVLPGIDVEAGITASDMLLIPLGGLVAMPVLLWLVQCIRAMKWVRRYPSTAPPSTPPHG